VGRGACTWPNAETVNGRNFSASKFVIATGSKPARPRIPGTELGITGDDLSHLKEQPKPLVIGGGGFETTRVFAS